MSRILTAFPPGFFDRYISGPCNNPLCEHPNCWEMRVELREFGERVANRAMGQARRRRRIRP